MALKTTTFRKPKRNKSSLKEGANLNILCFCVFPGGPVAKTPCSWCRGPGFDPWSGS